MGGWVCQDFWVGGCPTAPPPPPPPRRVGHCGGIWVSAKGAGQGMLPVVRQAPVVDCRSLLRHSVLPNWQCATLQLRLQTPPPLKGPLYWNGMWFWGKMTVFWPFPGTTGVIARAPAVDSRCIFRHSAPQTTRLRCAICHLQWPLQSVVSSKRPFHRFTFVVWCARTIGA